MTLAKRDYAGFYESWWRQPGALPAEHDPTIEKRANLLYRAIQRISQAHGPLRVLDAGCGSGFFTQLLASWGHEAFGLDISATAIARAQKLYPCISFATGFLEGPLPFDHGSFDVIFSSEVIEHIFNVQEMLKELNRILKPGGVLILTTPYHGLIKNLLLVLFNFDRHFNDLNGGHIRFFTVRSLTNLLEECRFSVKEINLFGRHLKFLAKSMFVIAEKINNIT